MKAKRSIIKINAPKYHKAAKKLKSAILNNLVEITHLHRKYLTDLLNNTGKVCYNPQGIRFVANPTITHNHNRGRNYTETLKDWTRLMCRVTMPRLTENWRKTLCREQIGQTMKN